MTSGNSNDPDVEVRYEDGKRLVKRRHVLDDGSDWYVQHDFPDVLSHFYRPAGVGQSIPLYRGSFRFADDPEGADWQGTVSMSWYPNPRVGVSAHKPVTVNDLMPDLGTGKRQWVALPTIEIPNPEPALPPQPEALPATEPEAAGHRRSEHLAPQTLGCATAVDRVTFLVANGWDVHNGNGICDPNDLTNIWYGRLEAFPADWHITIDRQAEVDQHFWQRLRDENASAVSHIGRIQKADGSEFNAEDAESVLHALRLALSLAAGRTVNALLPVGWQGEQAVWTRWSTPNIDGVRNTGIFLDRLYGNEQLREIIERVVDYCCTPQRLEVIQYATSYYVTATYDVNVELGVALPVSGLQLLAYNRFVEERATHTKKQWKAIATTEDEIRLLLDDCQIPTGLPATHAYLAGISAKAPAAQPASTPRDALGCVMLLRNKIVHPTSTKPGTWSPYEWAEAAEYAAHCLLLAILHTVGYQGRHRSAFADNIWEGVTEPVPWGIASTPAAP